MCREPSIYNFISSFTISSCTFEPQRPSVNSPLDRWALMWFCWTQATLIWIATHTKLCIRWNSWMMSIMWAYYIQSSHQRSREGRDYFGPKLARKSVTASTLLCKNAFLWQNNPNKKVLKVDNATESCPEGKVELRIGTMAGTTALVGWHQ